AAAVLINAASRNDGISLNEGVKFTKEDISKLLDSFQEQINKNKYSAEQFKAKIIDVVKSSLTLNNKPAFTLVKSASFDINNNEILIILNPQYEYSLSETYNDIVLNEANKTITISNLKLQFYDSCVITNTIGLFNALQNYIDTNKLTIDEISQELQIESSQFIDLIHTNLLIDNNGNNQPILVDNIKNIDINNNKLEITLYANYLSYSISNNNSSTNVELKGHKIIISNLNFYNAIVIENLKLNELQNNIQSLINTNQYTLNDFNNQLTSLTFKNQIANYLNIDISDINTISFDQGILKIIPKSNAKFVSSLNNNLIVNNTIQITNLEFYNSITLTKLNNLYTTLNTYIAQQKLTLDAFKNQVNSNNLQIRNLIKNNLFVLNSDGNEQAIDENKIKSFEFINNQVEVQLETNFMKYIVTSTDQNVLLENNKIIIKNLDYFEIISIDINNLNNLKQNIQNLINNNQWTENDFSNQLSLETFKNEIAKYLDIDTNAINTITFTNNILEISSPTNKKFEGSSFSSLITPNFTIQVSGFNFYTVANLTQLDVLYNAINTYISNHKFTINEFESEVNDNKEAIKQLIIDNLKVNAQTINSDWIEEIKFVNDSDNEQLEVTLNNYYIRYELTQTNNVKFENNKLIIS
ncbi:MAG: hypothetical protein K2K73_01615, partial [Ureaplasma sp.]|nr:hypothetical protein [Ureaplasma sp.]